MHSGQPLVRSQHWVQGDDYDSTRADVRPLAFQVTDLPEPKCTHLQNGEG